MAIINCPECNEKISNTAKQCIHCGASIVICPECQTAYVKGATVCTECGYEFKGKDATGGKNIDNKKDTNTNENAEKKKEKNQLLNAGRMHEKIEKRNKWNFVNFLEILFFIALVLIFCGAYRFVLATDLYGFWGMLFSAIVSVILVVLAMILSIFEIIDEKKGLQKFISFSREKEISLHQVIENTLNMDFHKMKADNVDDQADSLVPLLNAEIYDKDPLSKRRFKVWGTLCFVRNMVELLSLLLFIHHNLEIYFTGNFAMLNIFGISFPKFERLWLLILSYLPGKILGIYIKKSSKKGRRDWISKNFPQSLETYDKYLDGFYSTKKYAEDVSKNNTRGGV